MKKIFIIITTVFIVTLFSCTNDSDNESKADPNAGTTQEKEQEKTAESEDKKDSTELQEETNDTGENESILDIYTTTNYSMKVGESVTLKPSWDIGDNCYYTITSNDYDAIEISGKIITAKTIGTAIVKMTSTENSSRSGDCVITVTSEGFDGKPIENLLLGTWNYTGSSSSGTIVLNANMTGHITAMLQSKTVHDTDFIWNAYESKNGSTTYKYLTIKNADTSSLNGEHELKKLSATQFTLKGYLAFGMPSEMTWTKQ